ncbi:uncharacterized protein LOC125490950 [Plutella xylostella]|uniref:uncharacterized protein LOC125489823 n=1 Tax=Plutella xylostella TaxID=51655 RepID=UPI0020322541|nr:uncharacterized protein LOC125489823 [Plutella xylostella]XP_048483032.1 uncharacterized protein LOC125489824 isoform X2 [Plutella xylostella]XP_048483706.1 uncharacterized protein LOC119693326 [Plutella xylostella]XP_048487440.1 uncharacterized protein LOC125490950 [Plutella xylostella]
MPDQVGMESITLIPGEVLKIIPIFNGDKRILNLFLAKSEYIIERFRGNEAQDTYIMHAITSRLAGDAAALVSERQDIMHWDNFKELLVQHFGDPRNEECIAIELETLKINPNESYLDFCNRIQSVRSILISKVNRIEDANIKNSKIAIYTNTSLNVFLYNLPENMVRIVRLKAPATLEKALEIVLEEVNFHDQYVMRNKMTLPSSMVKSQNTLVTTPTQKLDAKLISYGQLQPTGLRPILPTGYTPRFNNSMAVQSFNNQPYGYRPQLGNSNPQIGYRPPQPQFGYKPPQFGYKPPQFGYKPPQFGYRPQFGMTTAQKFGNNNPQQIGYKPTVPIWNKPAAAPQHVYSNDVSMRTAPQRPNQGFKLNELCLYEEDQYQPNYYNPEQYVYLDDVPAEQVHHPDIEGGVWSP